MTRDNYLTEQIVRAAARPELAVVWHELGRRVGRGGQPRRLTLRGLEPREQSVLADLLGRDRLVGADIQLGVDALARAFELHDLDELTALAETVIGPIADLRAERAADEAKRDRLWSNLETSLAAVTFVDSVPTRQAMVAQFVETQRSIGVSFDDIDSRSGLHDMLIQVLNRLPVPDTGVAMFAAEVLGDPHALDAGRPLTRLVTDALVTLLDSDDLAMDEGRRDVWARVGLIVDRVSSMVLLLGVTAPAHHWLAGSLNPAAEANEPVVLTLRQLLRWPLPPLLPTEEALVVENPSVVEFASDRRQGGAGGRPLICSNGQPTVAVRLALRQLSERGATLLQHSDFDIAGIHIASWLQANARTTPWQMTATAYRQALSRTGPSGAARIPIVGPIPDTPWDPNLASAMRKHRAVVSEEHVAETLFD